MKVFFWILTLILLLWFGIEQLRAQQRYSTFELEAPSLNTTKTIFVYLPKNYTTSQEHFPVLYMHDAQNLFDHTLSFAGEWEIDETLDRLGFPLIVIGIAHGNEKRFEELTPYPHEKYGGGKADEYLDFVIHTLKPYVDQHYRTLKDSTHTGIMGSSLGGLISYYAALKHPDVFGKAGVFSPSFWTSNDIYKLTEQTPQVKSKIYLLCGDAESDHLVSEVNRMDKLLETRMQSTEKVLKIVPGGKHNEAFWKSEFEEAILWLFND